MLVDKDNFKKMAGFVYITCKYDGTGAPAATPAATPVAAAAQPAQAAVRPVPVQAVARPVAQNFQPQPVQNFQPAAVAAPVYTQPVAQAVCFRKCTANFEFTRKENILLCIHPFREQRS